MNANLLRRILSALACLTGLLLLVAGCNPASGPVHNKNVQVFTRDNFQQEVLSSSQPVLVDFWASWCGPCKMIAPTVAELATEYQGRAKVGKVDVDAETTLASEYNVRAIPTLMIFKDGRKVEEMVGARSKADLKAVLDRFVGATAPAATAAQPGTSE